MKVIDPITTEAEASHTRASTATYFNQAGVMQTAADNELRRNCWNPETGEWLGMLIEDSRTNYLLNTSNFSTNLATQTRSLEAGSYVLSFWGNGTVTATCSEWPVGKVLVGTGSYPTTRNFISFSINSTLSVTFTVDVSAGTAVRGAQVEKFDASTYAAVPSSFIPTTGSPITRAADITSNTGLLYSDFIEPTDDFDFAISYALGATVNYSRRIYESLEAANGGNYPDISPTKWLDTGPDNRFAMFDREIGKASTSASAGKQIVCYVSSVPVDAVALVRLYANDIKVAINTGIGYINTQSNTTGATSMVFDGFQPGYYVSVMFENGTNVVALLEMVCGLMHSIGSTQYGLSMGIADYSKKGYDVDTRQSTFIEGPYSTRMQAVVDMDKQDFNAVYALLVSIRAKPSVWVATDDSDYSSGAITYGFFQDFTIVVPRPTSCTCSLEILSLT